MNRSIFIIVLLLVALFVVISCSKSLSQEKQNTTSAIVDNLARRYTAEHNCLGKINQDGECVSSSSATSSSEDSDIKDPFASADLAPVESKVLFSANEYRPKQEGETGLSYLRALNTIKLKGNIRRVQLSIEIKRNLDSTTGLAGAAMYIAPLDENGWIIPSQEWKSWQYIGGVWKGNGKRNLNEKESFAVISGSKISTRFDADYLPVSSKDLYSKDVEFVNLVELINGNGVALMIVPSSVGYNIDASISYSGQLESTPI